MRRVQKIIILSGIDGLKKAKPEENFVLKKIL